MATKQRSILSAGKKLYVVSGSSRDIRPDGDEAIRCLVRRSEVDHLRIGEPLRLNHGFAETTRTYLGLGVGQEDTETEFVSARFSADRQEVAALRRYDSEPKPRAQTVEVHDPQGSVLDG
jgi:hypothetical protein